MNSKACLASVSAVFLLLAASAATASPFFFSTGSTDFPTSYQSFIIPAFVAII